MLTDADDLFGWDRTPGLIAFSLAANGRAMRVWRRVSGDTASEVVPFSPFLVVADRTAVVDAAGVVAVTALEGPGVLAWLARFETWAQAVDARDRCPAHVFLPDPVQQFLLLTGRTSFRDLRFPDLRRLAFDIEVVTTDGFEFPNALRAGDRIVAIAFADPTGFSHVIRGDRLDERELLEVATALIAERDPDVLEGHNVFRFDLPYLEARARLHGVPLAWGRDGSVVRGRPARLGIAERTIAYQHYAIAGRHVVDTWILAQLHDAGARDLPSFGLKELARHVGVAARDRTYVDGARVSETFRDDPERLMAYAADDARETIGIANVFAPPYFAQARLVPLDYQATILRGAAAKIDALLLRAYLHRGHAIPEPRPPAAVGGAHVALFQQGVAHPVWHVDVTSLYPSVMLARGIAPATDPLGVFLALLARLREFRVRAKRQAGEASDADARAHWGAMQQSFKILINAFYGYLAFSRGHWNDFDAANRVTAEGRQVVTAIIERLQKLGGVPLEADTDGVYFVPPAEAMTDDHVLLDEIARALPPGIDIELDGRYRAMLSYKLKTYALLDASDRITLKGSAFRSRAMEPFQRELIAEIVRLLVIGRRDEARPVVDRWLDAFRGHRVPPRLFARTETLQEALDTYRARVDAGQRPVAAVYELALASGRRFDPGDQLSFYVAGRSAAAAVSDQAKLVADWDPTHPDENVAYYCAKVLEAWERLRPFAEHDGLRPYVEEPPVDPQLSLF